MLSVIIYKSLFFIHYTPCLRECSNISSHIAHINCNRFKYSLNISFAVFCCWLNIKISALIHVCLFTCSVISQRRKYTSAEVAAVFVIMSFSEERRFWWNMYRIRWRDTVSVYEQRGIISTLKRSFRALEEAYSLWPTDCFQTHPELQNVFKAAHYFPTKRTQLVVRKNI